MNNVKEVLLNAAKLLEEKGWTQRTYARDKHGFSTVSTDDDAVCFCAIGAINRAGFELKDYEETLRLEAVAVLSESLGEFDNSISQWNDYHRRTKEEVISKLKEVAESVG
jgi:hypothetical protein